MDSRRTSGQGAVSGPRFNKDHWQGLGVVAASFAAAVSISWDSAKRSEPVFSAEPAPPTTEGIEGFPDRVAPIEHLERARALTPRMGLVRIEASGVTADGTVDVAGPGGRIRYVFQSEAGEGPEPRRPPGTLARQRYCGQQTVEISREGIFALEDNAAVGCEPAPRFVPPPSCGPQELWALARSKGAYGTERAVVSYGAADAGPVWRFAIEDTAFEFSTGPDCKTLER